LIEKDHVMKATIWHNPKCGTSRKTLAILQETDNIELTVVEYPKTPFSKEKLEQLFNDAGLSARQALRTRGSRAEELGLLDDDTNNQIIIEEMVKDSMLVERPFVETDKGVSLCRPQDKVHKIL